MPRDRDPVRSCFIEATGDDGKLRGTCRHCGKTYAHNTTRLRKHIVSECLKVPSDVSHRFVGNRPDSREDEEESSVDNPNVNAGGKQL